MTHLQDLHFLREQGGKAKKNGSPRKNFHVKQNLWKKICVSGLTIRNISMTDAYFLLFFKKIITVLLVVLFYEVFTTTNISSDTG